MRLARKGGDVVISVARSNLFAERTRLVISAGGVAFAVLLILILWSLYQGWNTRITGYIDSVPNDLWVAQQGTRDMFHSVSLLPASMEDELRALPEVARVERFVGRQVSFDWQGNEAHLFIVGYDTATGTGGPVKVVKGADVPGPGQIIVDRAFTKQKDVGIGDRLVINGRTFTVAGISEGGNQFVYTYAFMPRQEAIALLGMEQFTNFYLVQLTPGVSVNAGQTAIESRFAGVAALPKPVFRQAVRQMIDETFLPIIAVLAGIGFLVGVTVIGLTIYTATVEKSREYGVIKALGSTNIQLYRIVLEQALWSGVLGFGAGLGLTLLTLPVVENLTPSFVTALRVQDMLAVFGAAMLMALLASYIPVRRLVQLDPALVFRA
jgi:putative ABC transport system permease protein